MLLSEYIKNIDIDLIDKKLKNVAIISLHNILEENYMDLGLKDKNDVNYLSFKESLSLILTGCYTEPVLKMRLNIYIKDIFLGYYEYISKLDLTYIDEFFVVQ
ncbi:hypothetical protein [Snodgrassella sp.]|uniref:hypothetical protein n=1 Tax=Snodgrassella sp. TaxID=2815304 RepID=UPI002583D941|nr:hypothetical protein [Snodgrassella sp.]MCO6518982.1 hypothetical protein [Snodgrassella sp.]